MDADRFDGLTRSLSTAHSRRSLARLLGGLSFGGLLTTLRVEETVAAKRIGGAPCTKRRQCKTGKCAGEPGQKTCSCSTKFPTCQQPANPCEKAVCNVETKRCVTEPDTTKNGTTCQDDKTCQDGVCDAPPPPPEPCVGQATGTPCPEGYCYQDVCESAPTCKTYGQTANSPGSCTSNAECCSGACTNGGVGFGDCDKGRANDQCLSNFDCWSGVCNGYRCA